MTQDRLLVRLENEIERVTNTGPDAALDYVRLPLEMAAQCRARLTAEAAKDAEIAELQGKLRMIVSHASGGSLKYDARQSINDICVIISQHHNRIWEQARETRGDSK